MKKLVLAALLTSVAVAQNQERTFYFTQSVATADINAMITAIRTVAQIEDITPDTTRQAMVARAPLDKLALTEWVFHEMDQPASTITTPPAVAPEYRMIDDTHEIVRIFRLPATATKADLTSIVTAMRTVANLKRLFPFESQQAIVARGPAEQIAAADWLVHQLYPVPGENSTEDSPAYPLDLGQGNDDVVLRVLRAPLGTNTEGLSSIISAVRIASDAGRVFPFVPGHSIVIQGPPEKLAIAQWLVDELRNPSKGTPQTPVGGAPDSVVGVFYVHHHNSTDELASLVKQLRISAQIERLYSVVQPAAVVVRGRPDQIPLVEAMVAKFGADVQ